jgi:hypothetical protein
LVTLATVDSFTSLRNKETGEVILPVVEVDYEGEDGRLVYGTNSKKWHRVGPDDRDYKHGFTPEEIEQHGEKTCREMYLSATTV